MRNLDTQAAALIDARSRARVARTVELGNPFTENVRVTVRIDHGEAQDEHVRVRVGHDTQLIVLFLQRNACRWREDARIRHYLAGTVE